MKNNMLIALVFAAFFASINTAAAQSGLRLSGFQPQTAASDANLHFSPRGPEISDISGPQLSSATRKLGESTNLGLMLGANFSRFRNEGNMEASPVTGLLIGGFFRWSPGFIYLQPELLYSARGANISLTVNRNGEEEVESSARFKHLDLPVMLGLNLINGENFKLRLHAGPVASFLLDASDEIIDDYYGDADNDGRVEKASELYMPFVLGWQAGVGLDFGNFTFDARYESSFSDFRSDEGKARIYNDTELFNQNIRLSLGFMLF